MNNSLDNCMDKVYNIILVWLKYHTRIMRRFVVAILSVFLMVSCSDSKYDFDFKSTSQALDCYQSFCDETKGKDIAHSKDVVAVLKEWKEVRDTVLSFLQKDSAYYAHSWILSRYSSIDDSIRSRLLNMVLEKNFSLKDVAVIKRGSSVYSKDVDVTASVAGILPFFSRLDSIPLYHADKNKVLSRYRDFLQSAKKKGCGNAGELKEFVREEDRIFRTFLYNLAEMSDENLSDITKGTEEICNSIFKSASQGKIDSKTTLLIMSCRSNRRILLNAETCIESLRKHRKLSLSQKKAYYWMAIQPFVSIDQLGWAALSDEQFCRICKAADEIHRLDRNSHESKDLGNVSHIVNLILKLYLTSY